MTASIKAGEAIPRYETAQQVAPDFDLSILDESSVDEVPAGVDLYLVFTEPNAG